MIASARKEDGKMVRRECRQSETYPKGRRGRRYVAEHNTLTFMQDGDEPLWKLLDILKGVCEAAQLMPPSQGKAGQAAGLSAASLG